jgi:hypothetical protein
MVNMVNAMHGKHTTYGNMVIWEILNGKHTTYKNGDIHGKYPLVICCIAIENGPFNSLIYRF